MRVPAWMILGLLLAMIMMDLTTILLVRSRVINAAELALDAALVGGIYLTDRGRGELFIDEAAGYNLACSYFKSNLNLNSNLENAFLKNTKLEIEINQNSNKPHAKARVSTVITAACTKLLGIEGVPIEVGGTRNYVSKFK